MIRISTSSTPESMTASLPSGNQVQLAHCEDLDVVQIISELGHGVKVGIVCNTVRNAQAMRDAVLPLNSDVLLDHSRFTIGDRARIDQEVLKRVGKGSPDVSSIVVGTQVLEQSLDIDFDVLFTELAPMDSLLQRMGRLHRHADRRRPATASTPKVYVIQPRGIIEDHSPAVYGGPLRLEQARRTLAEHGQLISLPQDIEPLVERAYSREDGDLLGLQAQHEAKAAERARKAHVYMVAAPQKMTNTYGWLAMGLGREDEVSAEASVRDIRAGITALLMQERSDGEIYALGSPRGIRVSNRQQLGFDQISKIMRSQVVLPPFSANLDFIQDAENLAGKKLSSLQDFDLLRGEIPIILDESASVKIYGWRFTYSERDGLRYERER